MHQPVVSPSEWQAARDALLAEEKEATRARDALAAKRRRLPMVRIDKDYVFDGPEGKVDACATSSKDAGSCCSTTSCSGRTRRRAATAARCSSTRSATSRTCMRATRLLRSCPAPRSRRSSRTENGWAGRSRGYSSFEGDFNVDFGVGPETPQADVYQDGETFGLSVFLRDGDGVFRTYFTTPRGVEALGSVWTFLDLTPLGRQEDWEDSPEGYPQTKPYEWWRRHDEYERT